MCLYPLYKIPGSLGPEFRGSKRAFRQVPRLPVASGGQCTGRLGQREGIAVETPIPTLPGSELHRLCVEVYLRHHDIGAGICTQCRQRAPCLPRRHAASVVMASGEDPRRYDAQAATATGRSADAVWPGGSPGSIARRETGACRPSLARSKALP